MYFMYIEHRAAPQNPLLFHDPLPYPTLPLSLVASSISSFPTTLVPNDQLGFDAPRPT